jgi:hypothetical protein
MLDALRYVQVSRLKREVSPEQLQALDTACAGLPALVATGAQDGIVPRAQVLQAIAPVVFHVACAFMLSRCRYYLFTRIPSS